MNSIVCPSLLCHLNNWNLARSGDPRRHRLPLRLPIATGYGSPGNCCAPLSLTCQSNLLGPPQGSADRSFRPDSRTWASIRTRGKEGLTGTEDPPAAREKEARTSTPTLHVHLSIKPSATVHWCTHWSSSHTWISGHMVYRERWRPEVKEGRLKCRWSVFLIGW